MKPRNFLTKKGASLLGKKASIHRHNDVRICSPFSESFWGKKETYKTARTQENNTDKHSINDVW